MRYWPVSSLTTERTRSMSAGLVASTVTPGSTAPDVSLTTPVMAACAKRGTGTRAQVTTTKRARGSVRMWPPDDDGSDQRVVWAFYRPALRKATEKAGASDKVGTETNEGWITWIAGPAGSRQQPVGGKHLGVAEVGVPAAGIRQHGQAGALEGIRLPADWERRRRLDRRNHAVDHHPEQRHDVRLPPPDLAAEDTLPVEILVGGQRVDASGGTRDQVRQPISPLRQADIVLESDPYRHQTGLVEQLPEPRRIPGEVVAHRRRTQSRVDPDEQHANRRPHAIRQQPRAVSLHLPALADPQIDQPCPICPTCSP